MKMNSLCTQCHSVRATRHCNICREGFTCHQQLCGNVFDATHICKRNRENDDEEEVVRMPDLLERLMLRYKDVVQAIIRHLDTWDDVKNICNLNQTMRRACADFRELSGGIWQFLLRLYFPLNDFPEYVTELAFEEWPEWGRQHPYVYFRALLLAIWVKYGSVSDWSDRYKNIPDKILENLHNKAFNLVKLDSVITFNITPRTVDIDEMDENMDDESQSSEEPDCAISMQLELVSDYVNFHITKLFRKIATDEDRSSVPYASLTQYFYTGCDADLGRIGTVSVYDLTEFFFDAWERHGYSWTILSEIPKE